VSTPLPVVTVAGAAPAPPPTTSAFAASAALDAQVLAEAKYGIPPLVPAIVNAGTVVGLAMLTMPPVQPTLVTVPVPLPTSQPIAPLLEKSTSPFGQVPVIAAPTVTPPLPPLPPPEPPEPPEPLGPSGTCGVCASADVANSESANRAAARIRFMLIAVGLAWR
jgi:hypothetical protein